MAFDTTTRNRLAKFVAEARRVLTEEFSEQLQSLYGISASGGIAPLERLSHLDAEGLELAATLRQRIAYLTSSSPAAGDATKPAIDRLTREQAFTVLNRLAAIRMAEKRGLIVESVGQQYQSKGFKVFESVAGSAIGETYDRYRCYLFCLFDELAIDLGSLFDRRSPQALLFPRESPLLSLLDLLDEPDLQDLWAEDETIGWIYQYYNDPAERKKMREESAAPRNSRELAVRNQFFTPRYVVEFLTDNTLGRIWYEMTQGGTTLKEQCRYLVRRPTEIFLKPDESAPEQPTQDGLSQEDLLKQPVFIAHRSLKDPRSILMLDPACGSMHFGLYAFDLFEAIYDEAWEIAAGSDAAAKSGEAFAPFCTFAASFADKAAFLQEVPRMIVEHNLHGIDIDPRAAQIAGLSLWLRAQRAWHAAGVKPVDRPRITRSNIVCAEPMPGDKVILAEFVEQQFPEGERAAFGFLLETVFDRMTLAGEAGSLLKIEEEIRTAIAEAKKLWEKEPAVMQRMLFGGENAAAATRKKLDLSGITDEQFWEGAEERIYDALRDYAEQAESGGFQRRLFAEDAARGFAFIDVCRKRYDVALMNPPFGLGLKGHFEWLKSRYPDGYVDFFAAFIERMSSLCSGRIGAITSRSILIAKKLERLRTNLLVPRIAELLDLGWPVMDGATVQSCAYSIDLGTHAIAPHFVAVDRKSLLDKAAGLDDLRVGCFKSDGIYFVERARMQRLPRAKILYNLPPAALALFDSPFKMGESLLLAKFGMRSFDDFRFLRLRNEINPDRIGEAKEWEPLAKGGPFAIFYSDLPLLVRWGRTGDQIAEVNRQVNGQIAQGRQASTYYRLPGATYSRRCKDFGVRVLPAGFIIGEKGPSIMPLGSFSPTFLVGILNSRLFNALVNLQANAKQYDTGIVEGLPWLEFPHDRMQEIAEQSLTAIDSVRKFRCHIESETLFTGAILASSLKDGYSEARRLLQASATTSETSLGCINRIVDDVFNVDSEEIQALVTEAGDDSEAPEQDDPEAEEAEVSLGAADFASGLMSFLAGSAFGRWDIRYATGEQPAPELPDPFAPLPVCPPGQLQNAQGLPARPEEVPAAYPVRIPWDGILVDDPNHPLDIERRVREVIEIIWSGQAGGPTAETIENEACKILGVKTLRDYFRKPANFFADHLKRYSKSRRQAPIYWPLSTKSGSYTLWIYYHRLNDQTLHKCLADFLDPKIKDVENELGRLTGKDSGRAADLRDFLNELKDLKDEIERVIKLPWKPNLNDGVLITASPLWKLFRLSKWQKDLKACWEELEKGDYDWAHLAHTIWPERVEKVCEKDRSIAIAHGLEHLCKIEPPKQKKPRGKKASL